MEISEAAKRAAVECLYGDMSEFAFDIVFRDDDDLTKSAKCIQQAINEATAEKDKQLAYLRNEYAGVLAECDASHEIFRQKDAEIERLRELVAEFCDIDIGAGWRGHASNRDLFCCEYCEAEHLDCTMIEHTKDCLVTKAKQALAGEEG